METPQRPGARRGECRLTIVDEVKARVDIADLVGESVPLRKTGRTFKALCPFHTEKTPSFTVDPSRQTWRCFGACSEGGDVISWVMRHQGVEFREALRILADRTGLRLAPRDAQAEEREKRSQRLRSANEAATRFYRRSLQEDSEADEARAYLGRRGVSDEAADQFGLGYAPRASDALRGYLSARGFSADEIATAGLSVEGEGNPRDRFRGRLIFPIRDPQGRCVGFGARALDDGDVKYLNTPQTPLFDKSSLLYGLDRSRDAIRRADHVIVVEGYMDVIAAHQHEQTHVVASMGTALTEKQVGLIKPLTRKILLALDADAAGAAATVRGIDTTREAVGTERRPVVTARGLVRMQNTLAADIRIIELPEGRDPDDLIRLDPERWSALVREAPGYLDYRFRQGRDAHDLEDARERSRLLDDLLPLVSATSDPVVRAEYEQRLAQLCRVDVESLRRRASIAEVPPHLRAAPSPSMDDTSAPPPRPQLTRIDRHAETLIGVLSRSPAAAAEVEAAVAGFVPDALRRELLRSLLAGEDAASRDAEVEALAAELRARPVAPPLLAQPRVVAQQISDKIRDLYLYEEWQAQARMVADHQRELGADPLHDAAYALAGERSSGTTDAESSPAAQVLESHARRRALHLPRETGPPDPTGQPSSGSNGEAQP